jgi:rod shape-determining protein MreC
MPHIRSKTRYLAVMPAKQAVSRAGFAVLVALSGTLMMMSKTGNPAIENLRTSATDVVAPVLAVAARPIDAVMSVGQWFSEMAALRRENIALKNDNLRLKEWQLRAQAMEKDDKALRSLLKVVPPRASAYVTAPVVSDFGGPYVRSALLAGGEHDGIMKDRAVINESGLVGRVIEVGEQSARVLLLTDINSRIPVMAEKSGEKSIMMGNNADMPTLSYLSADSRVAVGERIVTSGDGGIFPKGIAVGKVVSAEDGVVRVQPYVDANRLYFVTVIDSAL